MTYRDVLLEDVLDALMLEEPVPSYAALIRWSERYPQHREALASFFATWAVQAELPEETPVDEDRVANLGVSHAINVVDRRNTKKQRATVVDTTGPRLIAISRTAGVSEDELVRRTGLDASIIAKLDLRRLTGIPWLCFERLAAALHASVDLIRPLITGPPVIEAGVRYKAKRRPHPVSEDFADAIRTSALDEPSKRYWLEAAERERRDK
jgi:hypothetical protein